MHDIVLECKGVSHAFGKQKVLHDINLRIVRGEVVSLVGYSGCGKSTLLRALLGTHPPTGGQVLMEDKEVTSPSRDRGIIYQRYALFPFLTAQENVAFGLKLEQAGLQFRLFNFLKWRALRKTHLKQAEEMLDRFKLGDALKLYPAQMSGGMCQRVAIAQALIMKPQLLLLDEPFGALDESSREDQQQMLLELYDENLSARAKGEKPPYTMVLVTHELNEAIYVSDRIVALSRHWLWEDGNLTEHPGATIVYDAASPASPRDPLNRYATFIEQRQELRKVAFEPAFDPALRRKPAKEYIRFWDEVQQGKGAGIMKNA